MDVVDLRRGCLLFCGQGTAVPLIPDRAAQILRSVTTQNSTTIN
jgi:hypothetical protein